MSEMIPLHILPAVDSDAPMHELSDRCPCRPLNEFVPSEHGRNEWRIIHKQLIEPEVRRPREAPGDA